MPITVDPNVVYLIFLLGMWLSVTAAYVPGTGVLELLAVVGVVTSVAVLSSMPTNWLSVVAIVVGTFGFFTIPLLDRRLTLLAFVGLGLQVVGSLTLFNGASVSLPLLGVIIIASLLYFRFALLPVLESQRTKAALIDDEPIVGAHGYVQRALNPVGTVRVRGESWTARSDQILEPGTEIVVVDREGLTLFVESEKQKRQETLEDINEYGT
jgi:membrane-bound ClpP family serine protease